MAASARRAAKALALTLFLVAAPSLAQEGEGATQESASHESASIQNWWSWDYGAGAKDPSHRGWPPPFGFALINFAVFLGIMSRLAWRPLKAFMVQRHDGVKLAIDEAQKLRAEAETLLKSVEQKVAHVDAEIDTLLAQIRTEAEKEKARIIAAAEADARRVSADAERQVQAEIERARRELRTGVIEAALAAAEDTLKKNIAADDQRKMAERYVVEVEQRAKQVKPS